ncbi:hypothetical protein RN001_007662 [Aquatica leii]|uniref:Uncharacterized protein n=1 Tax=Aquatica leii TaxID=1421715 RepID=A0AAN7PDF5_9COLE|nr:hypothetical protein RN001_007662 [Aquatica leii]
MLNLKEEICESVNDKIEEVEEEVEKKLREKMQLFEERINQMNSTSLIVSLRGEALGVLQTVPDHLQENYELLISRLEMRYRDAHLQQVYQAQIKSRVQKAAESLQEFEADIAKLTRLAYPTASDTFLEQLAIQTFVETSETTKRSTLYG